jgi:hypothetical protein
MTRKRAGSKSAGNGGGHAGKTSKEYLDPWALVWGQPYIDAERLVQAIEQDLLRTPEPDFRTRLLVRDSLRAIQTYWGEERFTKWFNGTPARPAIGSILKEKLGATGFHNIKGRLVASVNENLIQQVFRMLGHGVHDRIEVNIAGSIPTLIGGLTARPTDDIDFVDEVPAQIRKQHATLKQIKMEYGLILGHVQSHYLPANWRDRRHYLGDFGPLRVYTVDPYDIFVSKLSSNQEKHKSDLRVLATKLDQEKIRERLLTDGRLFWENEFEKPKIEANWAFIYGEPVIPVSSET